MMQDVLRWTRRCLIWSVLLLVVAATGSEARAGFVIIPTYDSSVPVAAQNAFNYAISEYEGLYSNNMTMRVNVQFAPTGLGASSSTVEGSFTYAQIQTALQAEHVANPSDTIKSTVVANLPATNPAPTNTYWLTTANAKALGLGNYGGSDGTIYFSNFQPFTYDPNHRAAPGAYDFIGVAEHEISEVMGRIPGLGADYGAGASYDVNDLYRFTNGSRNFTFDQSDPPGVYLSIDNGVTNVVNFYSQGIDNDDYRGNNPTDPYNQFTGTNQAHNVFNTAEVTNMDAIGYNLFATTATVPEPMSLTLLSIGLAGMAGYRWGRRRLTPS